MRWTRVTMLWEEPFEWFDRALARLTKGLVGRSAGQRCLTW